ncbi:hypothetical protein [Legionella quinlivanii]|uniref:hypothetical protein n=1 Tax=Legionella quinlivanii TaxID=45073 RepID=UPI002244C39F|nr:hypothetical protein [Legionella quinlivanii]MCW8449718.1 hypothetical protein [Legionella quinlivanii]
MPKIFTATGDGACIFNALAIGLAIQILSGRLDHYANEENYQALLDEFARQHPQFLPKSWDTLKLWLNYYNSPRDIELLLAPVLFKFNKQFLPDPQDVLLNELTSLMWHKKADILAKRQWFEITMRAPQTVSFPALDMLSKETKTQILENLRALLTGFRGRELKDYKAKIQADKELLELVTEEYSRTDEFQRGYSCGDIKGLSQALHLQIHENKIPNLRNTKPGIYLIHKDAHWDVSCTEDDGDLIYLDDAKLKFSSLEAYNNTQEVSAPPADASEQLPQIIIRNKSVNNPGLGNCAFYALATGLIHIIQEESSGNNRELFDHWLALQEQFQLQVSIDTLYPRICDFHIEESKRTREDRELLDNLQKALRELLFKSQLEELKQVCSNPGDDYTLLRSNSQFSDFAAVYHEDVNRIRNYNEFANSAIILREIRALKAKHDRLLRELKEGDDTAEELPFEQINLDLQSLFLRLLYGDDVSLPMKDIPFSEDSPIILGMKKITQNYTWGSHSHLDSLARTLGVNLHYLVNGQATQPFKDIPNQHCITIDNQNNLHWVTRIPIACDRLKKQPSPTPDGLNNPDTDSSFDGPFFDLSYPEKSPVSESSHPLPDLTDLPELTDHDSLLRELMIKAERSVAEYQFHYKRQWFSLFHRHGGTGQRNAFNFVQTLKTKESYEDALAFIIDHLEKKTIENGNTHPHSFRTILLKNMLDDQSLIPLKLISSGFTYFLKQYKERVVSEEKPVNETGGSQDAPEKDYDLTEWTLEGP